MNQTDINFNKQSIRLNNSISKKLQTSFVVATITQKDRISDALRTYATWLVRATRRKMATSGLEIPLNNGRIDLTKELE